MANLTPKQEAFANYYIETANATEAAIRAGYSKKTARFVGSENLTKPNICEYIDERMKEKDARWIASQDEILQYLTSVMRGQEKEQIPIVMQAEFSMIDKTPAVRDRIKAAELLGKRYALWTDKHEMDSQHQVIIIDNVPDDWNED